MKLRIAVSLSLLVLLLTGCYMDLAHDVTPPPGYQSPTAPAPVGSLSPASPPDLTSGKQVYTEKCAACHGDSGLGNGPQAGSLPVPVPAIGLAEISRQAVPVEWYTVITRGNIDRFMPGFTSLTDQQRWDVLGYIYSLSTTPEEIAEGRQLFAQNCAACHGQEGVGGSSIAFTDQVFMSKITAQTIFNAIKSGIAPGMPSYADTLSPEQHWAIAAYMRSLTFTSSEPVSAAVPTETPMPTAEAATETPIATVETPTESPATTTTTEMPATATEEPTATPTQEAVSAVSGTQIRGFVINGSGAPIPNDLTVSLIGFDHGDMATGGSPVEVWNTEVQVAEDGSFTLSGLDLNPGLILIAETIYDEVPYQSVPVVVAEGVNDILFEPLTIYETTGDLSNLSVTQAHFVFVFGSGNMVQLQQYFIMTNNGQEAVFVESDGISLPFMQGPAGSANMGYDANQGNAFVINSANGIIMPPTTNEYIVASAFNMNYDKELTVSIPVLMSMSGGSVMIPEGIRVKSERLSPPETRNLGEMGVFQIFNFSNLTPGENLEISLSGSVKAPTGSAASDDQTRRNLLIGGGILGFVLIAAGAYLFWRERDDEEEDWGDENLDSDETAEEIMDAIITLDDQYRSGSLNKDVYEKRRAELKARLKNSI